MDEMWRPKQRDERPRELSPEPWNHYAELRAKGSDDELSPEDFRQVIECEMTLSTIDNPTIQGVFDPEDELLKIKSLAHGQKKVALADFKDKLARQRRALMQCRLFIERTVRYDPDTKAERLKTIGDFYANRYSFSELSKGILYDIIYEYEDRHEKTRDFRAKHPDNAELIRELTGIDTIGANTQVTEGPLSIDIVTNRHTLEQLYKKNSETDTVSKTLQGFQGVDTKNNIYFTAVVDDAAYIGNIRTHEQEHAKNRVLREFLDLDDPKKDLVRNLQTRIGNQPDSEVRAGLREEELRIVRDRALDRAKDELTAMFKDGRSTFFGKLYESNGGNYDFLKSEREKYYKDPDYAELAHEILVDEYEHVVKESVVAFDELRNRGNHTTDEAIALLTDMPLYRWPSTVRHLLNYRKER